MLKNSGFKRSLSLTMIGLGCFMGLARVYFIYSSKDSALVGVLGLSTILVIVKVRSLSKD